MSLKKKIDPDTLQKMFDNLNSTTTDYLSKNIGIGQHALNEPIPPLGYEKNKKWLDQDNEDN